MSDDSPQLSQGLTGREPELSGARKHKDRAYYKTHPAEWIEDELAVLDELNSSSQQFKNAVRTLTAHPLGGQSGDRFAEWLLTAPPVSMETGRLFPEHPIWKKRFEVEDE